MALSFKQLRYLTKLKGATKKIGTMSAPQNLWGHVGIAMGTGLVAGHMANAWQNRRNDRIAAGLEPNPFVKKRKRQVSFYAAPRY
jgi:hypothetical protein